MLSRTPYGHVYVATTESGQVVLREVVPDASSDGSERLDDNRDTLTQVVEQLCQVSHPNLARVLESFQEGGRDYLVTEMIDGATLDTVARWHREPILEADLLRWGLDLVRLFRWLLADNPGPPVAASLQMKHLVVAPSGRLKLVHLGLTRLLDPDAAPPPLDTEPVLLECFHELMWSFTQALGKKGRSTNLTFLLNRKYETMDRLEDALRERLTALPQEDDELVVVPLQKDFEIPLVAEEIPGFWQVFLAQRPSQIFRQILVLVLVFFGIWYVWLRPTEARKGLAVYVSVGGQVVAVDPASRRILNSIDVADQDVRSLATLPGTRLLVLASDNNRRMRVLDTNKDTWRGTLLDDAPPSHLLAAEALFAFHDSIPSVSVFEKSDEHYLLRRSLTVGRDSHGLLLKADPERLVVSSSATDRVYLVDPATGDTRASQYVEGAGALAVAADGKLLLVAQPERDRVTVLEARTLKPVGVMWQTGGRDPFAFLSAPEAGGIWCVNRSGTLGLVDPVSRKLLRTVELPGTPGGAVLVPVDGKTELWVGIATQRRLVILDPESLEIIGEVGLPGSPRGLVPVP